MHKQRQGYVRGDEPRAQNAPTPMDGADVCERTPRTGAGGGVPLRRRTE